MYKRLIGYFQHIFPINFYDSNSESESPTTPRTDLDDKQIRQRSRSFDNKYTTKIETEDTTENECAVCICFINKGHKYKELECAHKYHEQCIKNWVVHKNKQTCPMCVTFIQGMNETIVKG